MAILTGDQVRAIRADLQLTQDQLGARLGYAGAMRRQIISKIETGERDIDYLRANLLLAMEQGYYPTGFDELEPR